MKFADYLTYEYVFNNTEHQISTPFVKSENDAIATTINTKNLQGSFIEYSNGIKVLSIVDIKAGIVSYYTNVPLKEVSNGVFTFDF